MPPLRYGTKGQIQFASENEFFESLGLLAKNDGTTEVRWERNEEQGAWGSEGRVYCYVGSASLPNYFAVACTAGTGGNVQHRINCNEYIQYIVANYAFIANQPAQNQTAIRATIPAAFLPDFERGLLL